MRVVLYDDEDVKIYIQRQSVHDDWYWGVIVDGSEVHVVRDDRIVDWAEYAIHELDGFSMTDVKTKHTEYIRKDDPLAKCLHQLTSSINSVNLSEEHKTALIKLLEDKFGGKISNSAYVTLRNIFSKENIRDAVISTLSKLSNLNDWGEVKVLRADMANIYCVVPKNTYIESLRGAVYTFGNIDILVRVVHENSRLGKIFLSSGRYHNVYSIDGDFSEITNHLTSMFWCEDGRPWKEFIEDALITNNESLKDILHWDKHVDLDLKIDESLVTRYREYFLYPFTFWTKNYVYKTSIVDDFHVEIISLPRNF